MNNPFASVPRRLGVVLISLVAVGLTAFFVATLITLTGDEVTKTLPVTQDAIDSAERRLKLERLKAETSMVQSKELDDRILADKMNRVKIEAERVRLGLPPVPPNEGSAGLHSLGDAVTKNLTTILAIMFAAILLPAFVNSKEPWRLGLMISALITVSGAFALAIGAVSQTSANVKLDIFSLTLSSSSVAVALAVVGAILTGFCMFMLHRKQPAPPVPPASTERPTEVASKQSGQVTSTSSDAA